MNKFALTFVAGFVILGALCSAQETGCGPNQIYTTCGTACPDYCHRDGPVACTLQCIVGICQCAEGYVQKYIDSYECVPARSCPRAAKNCGSNKIFRTCGTECPRYCGAPEIIPCTKNCVAECQCKPGYVLSSKTSSHCIPESECRQR